jgi:Secretion system C-terminal sorting domain/Domain of unknown function (DUF5122) beta-propeller
MKNSILFFSFVICSLISALCPAQTQFQEVIGGTGYESALSFIKTTDGGYTVAGYTTSFGAGGEDMYIVKFDASGTLQWSRTIGGPNDDAVTSIIQATDGGYVIAGSGAIPNAVFSDMYIVKFDAGGNLLWSKAIGGRGYNDARAIVKTTDGGYAVAGTTDVGGSKDFSIVKLDAGGNFQWSRSVGGINDDMAHSMVQTADGGYVLAGETSSFGAGVWNMYIVKLDAGGTLQWSKTFGVTGGEQLAASIIQTTDGGYALAGNIRASAPGSDYDMYILKLNSSGNLQWSKTVGGLNDDQAYSIIQTIDGGYAVAGWTTSFGAGDWDMYIVKLDAGGTHQWSRTIGGTGRDVAESIIQTTDSGYAVAGYTSSFGAGLWDMYIVKLDASGNTCSNMTSPASISGSGGTLGSPTSIIYPRTPFDSSKSSSTSTGGTLTSICSNIGIQPISNEIPSSYELFQNYPNPFNPTTKIKFSVPLNKGGNRGLSVTLTIYDILGKEVEVLVNQQLQPGTYEVEWNAANYPSGVYFYKLTAGDYSETKKMVLIK